MPVFLESDSGRACIVLIRLYSSSRLLSACVCMSVTANGDIPETDIICAWDMSGIRRVSCVVYVLRLFSTSHRGLSVRWRNVWSWSSRFPTARTRSWPPVCRASRAWTWTRSLSGHPRWEAAPRHFNNNITKVLGVDKAGRGKVRTPSKSFNYMKCDNKSRRLITQVSPWSQLTVNKWTRSNSEDGFFLQLLHVCVYR